MSYKSKALVAYFRFVTGGDIYYIFSDIGGGGVNCFTTDPTTGLPTTTNYVPPLTNFDVTTRPYYTAGTAGKASWSSFYDLLINPGHPSISFSVPIYDSSSSLVAVTSVSRHLQLFSDILLRYADRARVVYVLDPAMNLVATSSNEAVWVSASGSLKPAAQSSNYLIRDSFMYISSNGISTNSLFTMTAPSTGETLVVCMKVFVDPSATLDWDIVVVDSLSPAAPTAAPVAASYSSNGGNSADVAAAKDASTAAAVLVSLTLVLLLGVAGFAMHKVRVLMPGTAQGTVSENPADNPMHKEVSS